VIRYFCSINVFFAAPQQENIKQILISITQGPNVQTPVADPYLQIKVFNQSCKWHEKWGRGPIMLKLHAFANIKEDVLQ
jgi:hypothetical protein